MQFNFSSQILLAHATSAVLKMRTSETFLLTQHPFSVSSKRASSEKLSDLSKTLECYIRRWHLEKSQSRTNFPGWKRRLWIAACTRWMQSIIIQSEGKKLCSLVFASEFRVGVTRVTWTGNAQICALQSRETASGHDRVFIDFSLRFEFVRQGD